MDIQSSGMVEWLFSQGTSHVIMGIIIYWLSQRYVKVEDQKSELAKDIIKLTTLYESKTEFDRQNNTEIKALLAEIRDRLK